MYYSVLPKGFRLRDCERVCTHVTAVNSVKKKKQKNRYLYAFNNLIFTRGFM